MIRHLRYKAIRKKLYNCINNDETNNVESKLVPSTKAQSIFDSIPNMQDSFTPKPKNSKVETGDKTLDDIK